MNRRDFITTSLGASAIAGIASTTPTYKLEASTTPPPPDPYKVDWISGWRTVIDEHRFADKPSHCTLIGVHSVVFPMPVIEDIYSQLQSLKGQRIISFVPEDCDKVRFESLGGGSKHCCEPRRNWESFTREENREYTRNCYKIGYLSDVRHRDDYSKTIQVRMTVDDKFESLPFRNYRICVGIDSDTRIIETVSEPIDHSKPFIMKSCKVRGLYYEGVEHPNGIGRSWSLGPYYTLRSLDMFMYLPGRAYW